MKIEQQERTMWHTLKADLDYYKFSLLIGMSISVLIAVVLLSLGFADLNIPTTNSFFVYLINVAHLKAAQEGITYAAAERLLEADSLLIAQGISAEKLQLEYHGKTYGQQINDPRQARVSQKLAIQKILAFPLLYLRVHLTGIIPSLLDASVRDIYHFRGQERPLLGLRSLFVTAGIKPAFEKFRRQIDRGYLVLYLLNRGWLVTHYVLILFTLYKLLKGKKWAAQVAGVLENGWMNVMARPSRHGYGRLLSP